jgi:hypothetical protein
VTNRRSSSPRSTYHTVRTRTPPSRRTQVAVYDISRSEGRLLDLPHLMTLDMGSKGGRKLLPPFLAESKAPEEDCLVSAVGVRGGKQIVAELRFGNDRPFPVRKLHTTPFSARIGSPRPSPILRGSVPAARQHGNALPRRSIGKAFLPLGSTESRVASAPQSPCAPASGPRMRRVSPCDPYAPRAPPKESRRRRERGKGSRSTKQ